MLHCGDIKWASNYYYEYQIAVYGEEEDICYKVGTYLYT